MNAVSVVLASDVTSVWFATSDAFCDVTDVKVDSPILDVDVGIVGDNVTLTVNSIIGASVVDRIGIAVVVVVVVVDVVVEVVDVVVDGSVVSISASVVSASVD